MGAGELVVDVAKIKRAAHNAIALNILTYTLPHDIEVYMEEVLDVFLGELGQKKLKDYIVYCLRELAVNAKKANTKRVYFDSRGLDIDDCRPVRGGHGGLQAGYDGQHRLVPAEAEGERLLHQGHLPGEGPEYPARGPEQRRDKQEGIPAHP
jgi:hypothetical protein